MGFDFIVIAPLLPSHCSFSFVFGCGVSLSVSSSVSLSMIVQQLVVILARGSERTSFYYAILNQSPYHILFKGEVVFHCTEVPSLIKESLVDRHLLCRI